MSLSIRDLSHGLQGVELVDELLYGQQVRLRKFQSSKGHKAFSVAVAITRNSDIKVTCISTSVGQVLSLKKRMQAHAIDLDNDRSSDGGSAKARTIRPRLSWGDIGCPSDHGSCKWPDSVVGSWVVADGAVRVEQRTRALDEVELGRAQNREGVREEGISRGKGGGDGQGGGGGG
ncbi:hypothetical protein NL676_007403 [Syzygium grande]|nr:hypothetical protein NL676_007403 [Syzygium grande]